MAVVQKYKSLDINEIKNDFKKIDENISLLPEQVFVMIHTLNLKDSIVYNEIYFMLKDINLVYYGNKIENQTLKTKIKEIDRRVSINSLFYEGFGIRI